MKLIEPGPVVNMVSKRYYPVMERGSSDAPRRLAHLLGHIGRRTGASRPDSALTPVQWSALRYFSRANRFSRTPSAFARFQATTRGTASATIKALVREGYLVRRRSASDGRSVALEPSEAGRRLLEQDPVLAMEQAIGALPPEQRRSLADAVTEIIARVSETDGGPAFGTCHECRNLARAGERADCTYYCEREAAPLDTSELDGLCVHFEPGDPR